MTPSDNTGDKNEFHAERQKRVVPFQLGEWSVYPRLNRITGPAGTHTLEPKLMELLVELATSPGSVRSRRDLLDTIWNDAIVNEEVLTRGISELRRLLQDDTLEPRYIETIRKGGYRVIAEYQSISPDQEELLHRQPESEIKSSIRSLTTTGRIVARIILGAAIIATGIWIFSLFKDAKDESAGKTEPLQARPLTSYMGNEVTPALSPDGRIVAFSWSGPENDNYDIYVLQIGDASPLRLTEGPAVDIHPVWSPDGMRLAYISDEGPGAEIRVISVLGGVSRRILNAPLGLGGGFSWSPDSSSIVYSTRPSEDSANQLYVLDLDSGAERPLTKAPPSGRGDIEPEFSPDGNDIAFIRSNTSGIQDLWIVSSDGDDARLVRKGFIYIMGLDWNRSGSELLCSALYEGSFSLWWISVASGEISRAPVLGEYIYSPSVARSVDRLVYHYYRSEQNIWRIQLDNTQDTVGESIVASTHWEDEPSISPDGRKLAFISNRSGTVELWVSSPDGSAVRRITDFRKGFVTRPRWSPDSEHIAFNAISGGAQEIYTAELDGGSIRRLDTGFENAFVSDWSKDGRWLYISTEQAGRWDIRRMDLESPPGSMISQVAARNAIKGYESTDGYFYYSRPHLAGLWRILLTEMARKDRLFDEDPPWLPDLPQVEEWDSWTVCRDKVFVLDDRERGRVVLRYDPNSGRMIEQAVLPGLSSSTISMSHECETCYFVSTEREHGDLMIVEGFK